MSYDPAKVRAGARWTPSDRNSTLTLDGWLGTPICVAWLMPSPLWSPPSPWFVYGWASNDFFIL